MGANVSGIIADSNGDELSSLRPRLSDMPESCVALVLMHLDPPEICKLARLNRAFRGASSADFIWESKLPSNYQFIVDKVLGSSSKTKYVILVMYRRCGWIKILVGLCVSISSKALAITGIDDRRYWTHISTEESRFQSVAYLQQIWWFEVDGEFEFQFPVGTYSLFFRLQLGKPSKRLGPRRISHVFLENPGHWVHYRVADFVVEDPSESTKIKFH
ncbi:F-box protein PP2-A13 [Citrus sinensis]|nr:F-box protein PP2-A13 [Citrus sinensis]